MSQPAAVSPPAPADCLPARFLYAVFLVSGFAAILYQVVWQRSLFRLLGTSSESVTMVVTAFMLGLGLGSLAGGSASLRSRWPLPLIFGAIETSIGAFGLISMPLFAWIGSVTSGAEGLSIGLIAFAAVLVPTLFMGATLPILVAYLVRESGNVGKSVGLLYFINTLGSAAGSLAASIWILGKLGQSGSVILAAVLNLSVAFCVVGLHVLRRRPA
jgi:predicted membrane-bound spermidine synthase